eukprot:scaffold176966_cov26-Tisochrysis_lutea.AAC.1
MNRVRLRRAHVGGLGTRHQCTLSAGTMHRSAQAPDGTSIARAAVCHGPLSDIAHGLHLVRPLATNTVSISKKALPNSIQLMCVQSLSRCHQSSPRIELDRTTSHIAIMANSLTVVWRAAHNENIAGMLCSPWLPEPARTHCEVRLATYLKRRLEAALQ